MDRYGNPDTVEEVPGTYEGLIWTFTGSSETIKFHIDDDEVMMVEEITK